MRDSKPVIGLAGGVAAGKTAVASLLADLGAAVIDSDALNHEVLQSDEVREQIQSWWGKDIYDPAGRCDRRKLGEIVFRDPKRKDQLERLTHPPIGVLREELIREHRRDPRFDAIVLDSPLLFEAELDAVCDAVIFVDADETRRIDRSRSARGWKADELQRRENLQEPLDIKRNRSDYIVDNNSDINALRERVEEIYSLILAASQR